MSRKKKGASDKVKDVEVAESTPKKAPREASRVQVDSREKAREVIEPVKIALLEAHPTLPDSEEILEAFAEDYRTVETRRAERAAAAAAAQAEAARVAATKVAEKRPVSRRTTRPAWSPNEITAPVPEPVAAPSEHAPAPAPEPLPAVIEAEVEIELPPLEAAVEPAPPDMVLQPEPSSVFAEDAPLFGDEEIPPAEDIFASLGQSSAASDPDDFGFGSGPSEYSDPFIAVGKDQAASATAEPDMPTSTSMPAFDDVLSTPSEDASPTDRTTMIQAMPDDEPEGDGNGDTAEPEEAKSSAGRRSRKSSTRKKR